MKIKFFLTKEANELHHSSRDWPMAEDQWQGRQRSWQSVRPVVKAPGRAAQIQLYSRKYAESQVASFRLYCV